MERRNFLILGSLLGLSPYIEAEEADVFVQVFKEVAPLIAAVQEHMFPEGSQLPSAKEMHTLTFVVETVSHKTYDRDIRAFVLEGAKEFDSQTKGKFISFSGEEREQALRKYEESSYGRNWISRIMTLTMEGMFGDPIYGSNVKKAGWQALHTVGGEPRPKERYIDI